MVNKRQQWYDNIREELLIHEFAELEFAHLANVIASEEPTYSEEAHGRALTLVTALRRVAAEKCEELRKQLALE